MKIFLETLVVGIYMFFKNLLYGGLEVGLEFRLTMKVGLINYLKILVVTKPICRDLCKKYYNFLNVNILLIIKKTKLI